MQKFAIYDEVVRRRDEDREVGVILDYKPSFPQSGEQPFYTVWFPSIGSTRVLEDRIEDAKLAKISYKPATYPLIIMEPGDGTRYIVGLQLIDPQQAWQLGYDKAFPTYLFTFGTATNPHSGIVQSYTGKYITQSVLINSMKFEDSYNIKAALTVLEYLTGCEISEENRITQWKENWYEVIESLKAE